MTTVGDKRAGNALSVEVERGTVVRFDTVRELLDERLGPLIPAPQALADCQSRSSAPSASGRSILLGRKAPNGNGAAHDRRGQRDADRRQCG